jgi:hypothetical protein
VLATGVGFADLGSAGTDTGQLSAIKLGIPIALALFVVSARVVALHHLVEPSGQWWTRIPAFVFYLVFATWRGGFGDGFFWKKLARQEFTRRQFVSVTGDMASAVERANAAAAAETATLEAAQTARTRANTEAIEGRTCANRPGSQPGEVPLMRSRFALADRAASLRAELRNNWIDPIGRRAQTFACRPMR